MHTQLLPSRSRYSFAPYFAVAVILQGCGPSKPRLSIVGHWTLVSESWPVQDKEVIPFGSEFVFNIDGTYTLRSALSRGTWMETNAGDVILTDTHKPSAIQAIAHGLGRPPAPIILRRIGSDELGLSGPSFMKPILYKKASE